MSGVRIGRFQVFPDSSVGAGTFGKVYTAEDCESGERVCVKRIDLDSFGASQADIENELRCLDVGKQHPNIVEYLGHEEYQSYLWIFMELCAFGDLTKYLEYRRVRPPYKQIVNIMEQSSAAVEFLHSQSTPIIHRDIKLANLLVDQDEDDNMLIKLTDFGVSRLVPENVAMNDFVRMTNAGTPVFQAPEFFNNKMFLKDGAYVDIFSLGLVYLVLMTYDGQQDFLIPFSVARRQKGCDVLIAYGQEVALSMDSCKVKTNVPIVPVFQPSKEDTPLVANLKDTVEWMLKPVPTERPTAREVKQKLELIKGDFRSRFAQRGLTDSGYDDDIPLGTDDQMMSFALEVFAEEMLPRGQGGLEALAEEGDDGEHHLTPDEGQQPTRSGSISDLVNKFEERLGRDEQKEDQRLKPAGSPKRPKRRSFSNVQQMFEGKIEETKKQAELAQQRLKKHKARPGQLNSPKGEPPQIVVSQIPREAAALADAEDVKQKQKALRGRLERVKQLLDAHIDPSQQPQGRFQAIHAAAQYGHLDLVNLLLLDGADAAARNTTGVQPIHFACRQGNEDVVDALLKAGAPVNARDNRGEQPIHVAASCGHLNIVKKLVLHGADPAAQDNDGLSPTMMAQWSGHREVVKFLLNILEQSGKLQETVLIRINQELKKK